jgi:hypothetical protein
MDIQTFKAVASKLPPEIAVLMRGPTGIGKSRLARAAADELELPFVDVRLSTMSEGDVGGYPDIEGMKESGIMTFCMPSWFMRACKEPVVLMLDEMNRALPGVQQSAFQIVLDRELGNDKDGVPHRLHEGTRVFAAVNAGAEYDVNEIDPALLRRFWVCDLEPTSDDWLEWAANEGGIDDVIIEFIRQNPAHLRVDPSTVEPGTVCPNPASWDRLSQSLTHCGMVLDGLSGQRPAGLYAMAMGFIGTEASIALSDYVQNRERIITAEDILDNWSETKERVGSLIASEATGVVERLKKACTDDQWTEEQAVNVAEFARTLGGEGLVNLWNNMSATKNLPNIKLLHGVMGKEIVAAIQESRDIK